MFRTKKTDLGDSLELVLVKHDLRCHDRVFVFIALPSVTWVDTELSRKISANQFNFLFRSFAMKRKSLKLLGVVAD